MQAIHARQYYQQDSLLDSTGSLLPSYPGLNSGTAAAAAASSAAVPSSKPHGAAGAASSDAGEVVERQLRYYARFILVCILLGKKEVRCDDPTCIIAEVSLWGASYLLLAVCILLGTKGWAHGCCWWLLPLRFQRLRPQIVSRQTAHTCLAARCLLLTCAPNPIADVLDYMYIYTTAVVYRRRL